MRKAAQPLSTDTALTTSELVEVAEGWLLDCEMRQLSSETVKNRRQVVERLRWYLQQQEAAACGLPQLRAFLAYLARPCPSGRWGNAKLTDASESSTSATYFRILRTLFAFAVAEEYLAESPMERLKPPIDRSDQIQPFTEEQIAALLDAAKKGRHPKRAEAIFLLLLDTGMRASELCGLLRADVDMSGRKCRVLGKGHKERSVPFGVDAGRSLWGYLREQEREAADPLFQADSGRCHGQALTRSGLLQLVTGWGERAKIEAARCSPHTFRHTFAVMFLRNGGSTFALQEILGHTSLAMVRKYVALAQADIESQHRRFSPVDGMRRRK